MNRYKLVFFSVISLIALHGCGGSSGGGSEQTTDRTLDDFKIPEQYEFTDKFGSGESGVSYSGQSKRLVLIQEMVDYILGLSDSANQDVLTDLNFFFEFDGSASDGLDYGYSLAGETLTPGPTYGDIASGKSLVGKIAGNDPGLIGDEFFGWTAGLDATPTPEELVQYFFGLLDAISTDESSEVIGLTGGITADIDVPYVTASGLDLRQLIQKFLLGAVAFSQGTGDYLKADYSINNDVQEDGNKPYSIVEHEWDEAFGYFGAARNYNEYTDNEIAGKGGRTEFASGYNDANGDGLIDILSEINLGNSTNCAKRDLGAVVPTDFTKTAFDAFLAGRTILNATTGNLEEDALALLQEVALIASVTWEKCVAATVVHYINDVLNDMDQFEADGYKDLAAFRNHAKHWAEMKGFALGLQFNPDSPFRANADTTNQLKTLLTLMGDAPVLPDNTQNGEAFAGGVEAYEADLIEARTILQNIYGFALVNVLNW